LTAVSQQCANGDKETDKFGVVYGHAYAILDV